MRAQVVLEWIFGVGNPSGHEEHYKKIHKDHIDDVIEHFRDRPQDLLILDMKDRGKMRRLSEFLGQPIPRNRFGLPQSYPHKNIGRRNRIMNAMDKLRPKPRLN